LRKLELEQTREMWVVADYPDSAREAMPEPEIVMGLGMGWDPFVQECCLETGSCGAVYEG